ncbi:hypothetical protein, partial [Actinomyces succiniciruminis]
MRTHGESTSPGAHPASTPIAVPQGGPGPVVDAPCGAVRGVWRSIASARGDGAATGTGGPGRAVTDRAGAVADRAGAVA